MCFVPNLTILQTFRIVPTKYIFLRLNVTAISENIFSDGVKTTLILQLHQIALVFSVFIATLFLADKVLSRH